MKKLIAGVFFASLALASVSAVQAAPVAPVGQPDSLVTTVAGGCGPGWHRGPYGGCRRNFVDGPVIRRACPPGWHLGPRGGCRRNW